MITVQSFDNLQTVAPETKILALSVNDGKAELIIEMPDDVKNYFKTFLEKAHKHIGGVSCRIIFDTWVPIESRLLIGKSDFTISDKSLGGAIPKNEVILTDPCGHKKIVNRRGDR